MLNLWLIRIEPNVFEMISKIAKLDKNKKIKIKILNSSKKEISSQKLNFKKITRELKWRQKVSLVIGLKKTYKWYQDHINFFSKY